jgi:hypothetical protein
VISQGAQFSSPESGGHKTSQGEARRSRDEIPADAFPYPQQMRIRIRHQLPLEALEFFDATRSQPYGADRRPAVFTFEFRKVLPASIDPAAAREATSLEVSVRLAAHTCYALLICVCLMIPTIAILFRSNPGQAQLCELLTLVESFTLLIMIYNFRFFRTGEVERIFAFCFRHRAALKRLVEAGDSPYTSSART